jgi:hypothetical protein
MHRSFSSSDIVLLLIAEGEPATSRLPTIFCPSLRRFTWAQGMLAVSRQNEDIVRAG